MLNVEIKSAGSSAQSHAAPQWAEGDEEGDRGEEERGLQRWRRRRVGWRTGSCRIIKCSSHGLLKECLTVELWCNFRTNASVTSPTRATTPRSPTARCRPRPTRKNRMRPSQGRRTTWWTVTPLRRRRNWMRWRWSTSRWKRPSVQQLVHVCPRLNLWCSEWALEFKRLQSH